jgi:hypothetical protein
VHDDRGLSRRAATVIVVVSALAVSAIVSVSVLQYSRAAFTATSANTANSWSTGSVAISDDDTGTAMFNASNMTGGQSIVACIKVTYSGTVTNGVAVKLYGTSSGALAPYLNLTIEQGTGGSFSSCAGFSGSQIYSGTVSGFSSSYTSFASGLAGWSPSSTPDSKVYRFTITVQNDNNAQSKTASADYTWEAQA